MDVVEYNNTGLPIVDCKAQVDRARECDLWFLARTTEWMTAHIYETRREKIVAHCHGGAETRAFNDTIHCDPYTGSGFQHHEAFAMMDAVVVNSAKHLNDIRRQYGTSVEKFHVLGFPLDFRNYQKNKGKGRSGQILVPGRFSPEKNQQLLAEALYPLRRSVCFCTPQVIEGGQYHIDMVYHLKQLGFTVKEGLIEERYLKELQKSNVVVLGGLNETLNLCAIEGLLSGCRVVAPRIPPYTEYLDGRYACLYQPMDLWEIRAVVEDALKMDVPEYSERLSKYHWSSYGKGLVKVLRGLL